MTTDDKPIPEDVLLRAMREMGRRGGAATKGIKGLRKGFATMDPARRAEISREAARKSAEVRARKAAERKEKP